MASEEIWDESAWEVIRAQSDVAEFDWYACDRNGFVAAINSYGVGPSPSQIRSSRVLYNRLFDFVWSLPVVTTAIQVANIGGKDWLEYAERGLFAYDNGNVHATIKRNNYELIAKPTTPKLITELRSPSDLKNLIAYLDLDFRECELIPFDMVPP